LVRFQNAELEVRSQVVKIDEAKKQTVVVVHLTNEDYDRDQGNEETKSLPITRDL